LRLVENGFCFCVCQNALSGLVKRVHATIYIYRETERVHTTRKEREIDRESSYNKKREREKEI
jgi:hypothetical protein